MVTGIIATICVTIIIVFVLTTIMRAVKMQGYTQGTIDEAKQWVDAITKVKCPNWQSLPPVPGEDPEKQKLAAQVYVAAFNCALDVIKEEIAMNRIEAMVDEMKTLVLEQQEEPRYPIA